MNQITYKVAFCLFVLTISPIKIVLAQNENLKCGVITAQTGPLGVLGAGIKNAIVLAQKQSPDKITFIYEDDQYLPKNTVSAVKKLIDHNKVKCLISFGSTTSLAIVDIVEKSKVPLISIAITPKVTQSRSYVYRAHIPIEKQSQVIHQSLAKKNYKSIAILTTIQDATLALRDNFLMNIKTTIALDQQVAAEDRDFNVLSAKIVAANPDAVFLNLLPPQGSLAAKQLRALGFKGQYFSGPPIGNPSELKASDGALEGTWFVSFKNDNTSHFFEYYKNEFNEDAPMEAIYGFEAAKILLSLDTSKDLNSQLKVLDKFEGALGSYGIKNNNLDFPAAIWNVKNSQFSYCDNGC